MKPGRFVTNTVTLVGGNIIAEAIAFALMPIITRLYPPQAFGIISILLSIVGPFAVISTLRYNIAIQLPVDEEDADALALLATSIVLIMSLVLLCVVILWGSTLARLLKMEGFTYLLYFVPVAIFLTGTGWVLNAWYLRAKEFKRMALSKIVGAVSDRTVTLSIGFGGLIGPGGLAAGKLTGSLMNNLVMIFSKGTHQVLSLFTLSKFKRLRKVAIRYKEFPKYVWSGLFQQLSMQMPVILLGCFFTPSIVGYFALSRRALTEPMALIGEALSRSFYQKVSETYRVGKSIDEISERLFRYLMLFAIFPLLILAITSEEVFSLVFGEKWQEAGLYARLLAPTFFTIFLFQPIGVFFDLLEKQRQAFMFNFLFFLISTMSVVAGGLTSRPLFTVGLFSLFTSVVVISRILWLMRLVGVNIGNCARLSGSAIARSIVFALPVIFLKWFCNPPKWIVIFVAGLSLALYFFYLLITDSFLKNEVRSFIRHTLTLAFHAGKD